MNEKGMRKPIAVTFSGEVFYTQRDWDAYCKKQLKKLDKEEKEARGA